MTSLHANHVSRHTSDLLAPCSTISANIGWNLCATTEAACLQRKVLSVTHRLSECADPRFSSVITDFHVGHEAVVNLAIDLQ